MKFNVKFEVFESLFKDDDVTKARERAGKAIGQIQSSGKLVDGGMFADGRSGYLLIEINQAKELMELLAPFIDFVNIESHPVYSMEELKAFFETHTVGT